MGRKKKNGVNPIVYLIVIIIMAILSATGIEFGNVAGQTVNVASLENLENITITTGSTINDDFVSPDYKNLKVYFFDVGQADSILIMNEDKTMLIDAGNNDDGELIVKNLKKLKIFKIDYLIGTHPHEDHIGGLDDIIKNFDIGTIYMPKVQTNTKTFEDVLDAVLTKNLKITTPSIGETFKIGNAECEVLAVGNNADNLNSTSIVIQMDFDGISYAFMGDAEEDVESSILSKVQKINVLKVGHHGSSTSNSEKFINKIAPDLSVISVKKGNSYNHPHEITLKRLENVGSKIYRTDEVGNIMLEQKVNK